MIKGQWVTGNIMTYSLGTMNTSSRFHENQDISVRRKAKRSQTCKDKVLDSSSENHEYLEQSVGWTDEQTDQLAAGARTIPARLKDKCLPQILTLCS